MATTPAQLARLRGALDEDRAWGVGPDDAWELSARSLAERLHVAGAPGALFSPHCARVQPAKLVRGLADAVERRGVVIYERTAVDVIAPHSATTRAGTVSARWVVRATEGYTAGLPGTRRALLPMNSAMVVTEPLGEQAWASIGWDDAETLADGAHVYVYAQRTADGRIALGRPRFALPVRVAYGSQRAQRHGDHPGPGRPPGPAVAGRRRRAASPTAGAASSGWPATGARRSASTRATGLAWAGGYIGDGVTAAHVAGRTLADLICGDDTERTRLAWVGHRSPSWEPEPLRWLGVQSVYALYRAADRSEAGGRRSTRSRWATVAGLLAGRH